MLIHTLALSSILFAVPPHLSVEAQSSGATTRQEEASKRKRTQTEQIIAEILRNEVQAGVSRDFNSAMIVYQELLDRIVEAYEFRERDVKGSGSSIDFEPALTQWITSVLITRGSMGQNSAGALRDLRESTPNERFPENKEFATLWHGAFDRATQSEKVTSRVSLPELSPTEASAEPEGSDPVRRAVQTFLRIKNHSSIVQLGRRAIPTLTAIVEKDLDQLSADAQHDPLVTLARIDDEAAASLILRNLDVGGTLWRSRVLRLLSGASRVSAGFRTDEAWTENDRFPRLLRPHWLTVLERLSAYDDVHKDTIEALDHYRLVGALTPRLQEFLESALQSEASGLRAAAMRVMRYENPPPTVIPVARRVSGAPYADVRAWAAECLGRLRPGPELLALAKDSSEVVRSQVLEATKRGTYYDENGDRVAGRKSTELLPGQLDLLLTFLADPSPKLRREAVRLAKQTSHSEIPEANLLPLLRDPDQEIRRTAILWIDQLPAEKRAQELERHVTSESPEVLGAFDYTLLYKSDSFTPEELLRLTTARVENESHAFWNSINVSPNDLLIPISLAEGGIEQMATWALTEDVVLEKLAKQGTALQLNNDTFRRLLFSTVGRGGMFSELTRLVEKRGALQFDASWLAFAKDKETPIIFSLRSLELASRSLPAEAVELFRTRLDEIASQVSMDWLPGFIEDVPAAPRNAMIASLLEHSAFAPNEKDKFAKEYAPSSPNSEEIQAWILDAYAAGNRKVQLSAVKRALEHMVILPESARPALLMRAIKDASLCGPAREAIVALRNPEYLPLLSEVLRGTASSEGHTAALDVVQSFMSDEAAEVLIEAAGLLSSATLRKRALDRVAGIREYQDATDRWAARKTSRQNRESVIGELLSLLDDPDPLIRVEAIRGLGTFEATEHLPRLILMLKDPLEEIRDAARAAIERIHATPAPQAK